MCACANERLHDGIIRVYICVCLACIAQSFTPTLARGIYPQEPVYEAS